MGHRFRYFTIFFKDNKKLAKNDILKRLEFVFKSKPNRYRTKEYYNNLWNTILSYPHLFGVKIEHYYTKIGWITVILGAYYEDDSNILNEASHPFPYIDEKYYPDIQCLIKSDDIAKKIGKFLLFITPIYEFDSHKPYLTDLTKLELIDLNQFTTEEKFFVKDYYGTELDNQKAEILQSTKITQLFESEAYTQTIHLEISKFIQKFTDLLEKLHTELPNKKELENYSKITSIGSELEQLNILSNQTLQEKAQKDFEKKKTSVLDSIHQMFLKPEFQVLTQEIFQKNSNIVEIELVTKIREYFDKNLAQTFTLEELELLNLITACFSPLKQEEKKKKKKLTKEVKRRLKSVEKYLEGLKVVSELEKQEENIHQQPKKELLEDLFEQIKLGKAYAELELTEKKLKKKLPKILAILQEIISLLSYYDENIIDFLKQDFQYALGPLDNTIWYYHPRFFNILPKENKFLNPVWLLCEVYEPFTIEYSNLGLIANLIPNSLKKLQSTGVFASVLQSENNFVQFTNNVYYGKHYIWRMGSSLHTTWKLSIIEKLYPYYRASRDSVYVAKQKRKMKKVYQDIKHPYLHMEKEIKLMYKFGFIDQREAEERMKKQKRNKKGLEYSEARDKQHNRDRQERYQVFLKKLKKILADYELEQKKIE